MKLRENAVQKEKIIYQKKKVREVFDWGRSRGGVDQVKCERCFFYPVDEEKGGPGRWDQAQRPVSGCRGGGVSLSE